MGCYSLACLAGNLLDTKVCSELIDGGFQVGKDWLNLIDKVCQRAEACAIQLSDALSKICQARLRVQKELISLQAR